MVSYLISGAKKNCCGCFACKQVCPASAIKMVADYEGFLYPTIDSEKCIKCSRCTDVCQYTKLQSLCRLVNKPIKVYAAWNIDNEGRMNASSGGIFGLLAKDMINHSGLVFGAIYDENYSVKHCGIETDNNIRKLETSKYVQSDLNDVYNITLKNLNDGRQVFSNMGRHALLNFKFGFYPN